MENAELAFERTTTSESRVSRSFEERRSRFPRSQEPAIKSALAKKFGPLSRDYGERPQLRPGPNEASSKQMLFPFELLQEDQCFRSAAVQQNILAVDQFLTRFLYATSSTLRDVIPLTFLYLFHRVREACFDYDGGQVEHSGRLDGVDRGREGECFAAPAAGKRRTNLSSST